jgi:hypothetical protein
VSEDVSHDLAFAVRVDDAFTDVPVAEELAVVLDTGAQPVAAPDHVGGRQADGTYRFLDLGPGTYLVSVTSPSKRGFTWDPTSSVTVPVANRADAVVVPMWPTPQASAPTGTIALRAVLDGAAPAQEIRIRAVLTPPPALPPPVRRARSDADGELLFVVAGATQIDDTTGLVPLHVDAPGHAVTAVDVVDGVASTTYAGADFFVPPRGQTRVRIHLS